MPPRQTTKLDTPSTLVFWWKGPNSESLYHIKSKSGKTVCGLVIPSTSETMVVPNTDVLPRDSDMCQTCKRLAPRHR